MCYLNSMDSTFWSKVEKGGEGECWLWNACKNACGYGQYAKYNPETRKVKQYLAHRYAYILIKGDLDSKVVLRHSDICNGKRNCVNPDHLTPGTQKENVSDMIRLGRGANHKGQNNGRAKFTDEQIKDIRSSDKSREELAEKYNVWITTIRDIQIGKTWKHIH